MRLRLLSLSTLLLAALSLIPAAANERYAERPPLVVSPDLSSPWVLQLQRSPAGVRQPGPAVHRNLPGARVVVAPPPPVRVRAEPVNRAPAQPQPEPVQTAAATAGAARQAAPSLDPRFLPQVVEYGGPHKPGTIVVDTTQHFLFLVLEGGQARRYGVGTGKPGFEWAGRHRVTMKREWPDWRPPQSMIERERRNGRILPAHMAGGPENPLGARALYLGSTLYRIHGTNQPWSIGRAVSSGCIRMRNEDVIDLYERVPVGAEVIVI
ncbi:L,D-transpeptidase family protein [Chelativorans sp. ZYF759]|uniref:L,D-transpeptidase n=1 Tax=Chelativorans sp. ZYF759 TaxID=2692213 RepID=UPI00145CEFD4|nr:L,D-transpeptidase [Chelativorans sp. ZYF759]NMG40753.1 L,D-transpeptidase family protein [Chelativorans sp. ZYF759]